MADRLYKFASISDQVKLKPEFWLHDERHFIIKHHTMCMCTRTCKIHVGQKILNWEVLLLGPWKNTVCGRTVHVHAMIQGYGRSDEGPSKRDACMYMYMEPLQQRPFSSNVLISTGLTEQKHKRLCQITTKCMWHSQCFNFSSQKDVQYKWHRFTSSKLIHVCTSCTCVHTGLHVNKFLKFEQHYVILYIHHQNGTWNQQQQQKCMLHLFYIKTFHKTL